MMTCLAKLLTNIRRLCGALTLVYWLTW